MQFNRENIIELAFFLGLGALGFVLFLGAAPLFDWDEINFAESAREMLVTGNFFQVQINYEPFWEKPPLFFWMQALSMKIFGVNEFAARFPNAIIGLFTVWALYYSGLKFKNRLLARILAGLYLATFLPVIYFKSGIIDPVFNFFIFMGLFQIMIYEQLKMNDPEAAKKDDTPWSAGFWIGIATLTKGPVALLVSLMIYGLYKAIFDKFRIPLIATLKFLGAWVLLVLGWYGIETLVHGPWFVETFIQYQIELFSKPVAGHQQPFYYHIVVFIVGCFPLSAFAFRGMFVKNEDQTIQMIKRFMLVWFWSILVLFSIVATKIIHYSSLLYFPGVFLAAIYIYQLIQKDEKVGWDVWTILGLGLVVWGIVPSLINWVVENRLWIGQQLNDPFARAQLRADIAWSGWEWLIGFVFLLASCWNLWQLKQKKYLPYIYFQLVFGLLFVNLTYKYTLPKIAEYTQGAPLKFYEQLQGKDVYVLTAGYKSYLPYFYGRVKPSFKEEATDKEWLISGEVDKDVYLSTKITKVTDDFKVRYRAFEKLYEAGGFVFFVRKKSTSLRVKAIP